MEKENQNTSKKQEERKTKKELLFSYGLPQTIWRRCRYNHQGNWILDMSDDKWCFLSAEEQQQYSKVYQENYAKSKNLPLEKELFIQGMGFKFVLIPPGKFWMGAPLKEIEMVKKRDNASYFDSEIRHRVLISEAYYLGKYQITKVQWQAIMGQRLDSYFKNSPSDAPMENISWEDCQSFCRRTGFKLPTEAQWEYACRSGVTGMSYIGDFEIQGWNNAPQLDSIAWYAGNSQVEYEGGYDSTGWEEKQYNHKRAGTHSVGEKAPNAFGCYDMLGNVWEWCQDSCDWNTKVDTDNYKDNIQDPESRKGIRRILRGGAWCYNARYCRSANRFCYSPSFRVVHVGFRILSPLPDDKKHKEESHHLL